MNEKMSNTEETIPETEAGEDWLQCIEYGGPGAKDPVGGITPSGWDVLDFVQAVKIKRGKQIIEVAVDELKKGDKIIKAILDESIIEELYNDDPMAIRLQNAEGKEFTRLSWYRDYAGRDGLRTWATGATRRKLMGSGVHF